MNTVAIIKTISSSISFINALIELTGNAQEYRNLIAQAVSENREITNEDLDKAEKRMFEALEAAKPKGPRGVV